MTNSARFSNPREVHFWQGRLHDTSISPARLESLLNATERDRASRFRFAEHREAFVVARGLLRVLLGRYLDRDPQTVVITEHPGGKPHVAPETAGMDLRFNISHTKDALLYGFADSVEIGVDVEQIDRRLDLERLMERVLSVEEADDLRGRPTDERAACFVAYWTQKEAYLKALGIGLAGGMSSISLDLGGPGEDSVINDRRPDRDASTWTLFDVPFAPGYRAAAAVALPDPQRCYRRLADLA